MKLNRYQDYPNTGTPLDGASLNANQEIIEEAVKVVLEIIGVEVNTYDTNTSYGIDDFVVYDQKLWRCTTATSGTWNEANWVRDSILVNND